VSASNSPKPESEDLAELHRITATYLPNYPESTTFRSAAPEPPDDPLLPFADDLRRSAEVIRSRRK
jgi:hypothetical protein